MIMGKRVDVKSADDY